MINLYIIEVKTVEGDGFRGQYAMLPSRRELIADMMAIELEQEKLERLIQVVRKVINWPNVVTTKRIEIAVEKRRRIGTIVFSHKRVNKDFSDYTILQGF